MKIFLTSWAIFPFWEVIFFGKPLDSSWVNFCISTHNLGFVASSSEKKKNKLMTLSWVQGGLSLQTVTILLNQSKHSYTSITWRLEKQELHAALMTKTWSFSNTSIHELWESSNCSHVLQNRYRVMLWQTTLPSFRAQESHLHKNIELALSLRIELNETE